MVVLRALNTTTECFTPYVSHGIRYFDACKGRAARECAIPYVRHGVGYIDTHEAPATLECFSCDTCNGIGNNKISLESLVTSNKSLFIVAVCYKFVLHIEVFAFIKPYESYLLKSALFLSRYKITQLSQYYVTFFLLLFLLLYEAPQKMYGDAYASVEMDDENEKSAW